MGTNWENGKRSNEKVIFILFLVRNPDTMNLLDLVDVFTGIKHCLIRYIKKNLNHS